MDISTGLWFEYLRKNKKEKPLLEEGLRDIGLPEVIVDRIENVLSTASEKAKTWIGHQWKNEEMHRWGSGAGLHVEVEGKMVAMLVPGELPDKRATEEPEKWEKIKFQIKNATDTVEQKPYGAWSKSFKKILKNLSKLGEPSEKVEEVQEYFRTILEDRFEVFYRSNYDLINFLKKDATNYELIDKDEGLAQARIVASKWWHSQEDPDFIVHTFDDGSYWYDLDTDTCEIEAERMGHCGADSRGTLYSLRKKEKKRRESDSYVTLSYNPAEETIYQIKGRFNQAPPESVWSHIDWFINEYDVKYVREIGEHSEDEGGIMLMIGHLQDDNPGVQFSGMVDMEAKLDEANTEMADLVAEYSDMENVTVEYDLDSMDEENYQQISAHVTANISFEVALTGWQKFSDDGDKYTSEGRFSIPKHPNHGGDSGESAGFEEASGIDDLRGNLPGSGEPYDDAGWMEYDVRVIEHVDPLNPTEGKDQAFLRVRMQPAATFNIFPGEDYYGQNPADAPIDTSEPSYFFEQIKDSFEDSYESIIEDVRQELSDSGYIAKNAWDSERDSLSELGKQLDNFVGSELTSAGILFWFAPGRNMDKRFSSIQIPTDVLLYGTSDLNVQALYGNSYTRLFNMYFKGHGQPGTYDYTKDMETELRAMDIQSRRNPKQMKLKFKDTRFNIPTTKFALPRGTTFEVEPEADYSDRTATLPTLRMKTGLTFRVTPTTTIEEMDNIIETIKYLDQNPQMVIEAADEIISVYLEPLFDKTEKVKKEVLDGTMARKAIADITSTYEARAMAGFAPVAEKIIMIMMWIRDNWDKMREVEKYIALKNYLLPMERRRFRSFGNEASSDDITGKPVMFDTLVQDELTRRGATSTSARVHRSDLSENIEEQIMKIESILNEKFDLRLYKVRVQLMVRDIEGRELDDLKNAIRAIEEVTTVRTITKHTVGIAQQIVFEVKFLQEGIIPRNVFIRDELIPALHAMEGIAVEDYGKPEEVDVSLNEYSFGGMMPSMPQQQGREMPTPVASLAQVAQDWMDGGVQLYDAPMNTNQMQYHLMASTDELWKYCSREYRAPADIFDADDAKYQDFIATGADMPVYVAVGMNGKIKITGNEDFVWFAHRAGAKELPVFLSYQKQV